MVIASGTVAGALVFAASFSTWSFYKEAEQRQRAEQQQHKAEESDLQSRKLLYDSDMFLAYRAYEHGDLELTHRLLDRYRPGPAQATQNGAERVDLRGWEWRHLWARMAQRDEIFTLRGHQKDAQGAVILPDGHTVVSTGWDGSNGTLCFWNLNRPAAVPESVSLPGGAGFNSPLRRFHPTARNSRFSRGISNLWTW